MVKSTDPMLSSLGSPDGSIESYIKLSRMHWPLGLRNWGSLHQTIYIYIYTSNEKHSLTRKLVGYRNWRQWWCKKERNTVLRKG